MCGIAGVLAWGLEPGAGLRLPGGGAISSEETVARMAAHLRHRGPDGCGSEAVDRRAGTTVAFGHTRLAILDLSPAGRQPMAGEAGASWITFNGEIYNFRALRQALDDGAPWRSQSDTEVILRAYARWGRDSLRQLRGMFAFAIWDANRRELFLARDRLGIKPLYYYTGEGYFLFASELRALLASGLVPRRLDAGALSLYLAYQSVPAPHTLIGGVRALPPGEWLVVDEAGRMTPGRYWNLLEQASGEAAVASPAESRRRVRDLLQESVALHLVSDVPVGAFLSGGIDSSAVVALMREAGQQPRSFTIGFAERPFDESDHARVVAERFRTDHTEVRLGEGDLLDQLPAALAAMDHPTGDGVNTYVVARAVHAAGIKVALSGLGGDELFAGYPSFTRLARSAAFFRLWGHVPPAVRALTSGATRALGGASVRVNKVAAMLGTDGSLAALFPTTRQVLSPAQRRTLLDPAWIQRLNGQWAADPYGDLLRSAFEAAPEAGLLSRISYAEARTYMHDVLLQDTDQMSMAHALEVRVPLLDHELVEYVIGLPDAHKRPDGTPKRLLVESLGGLLPDEIVHRPKQGFTLPFAPWMRGPLRAFCEARLERSRLGGRGIFRPDQVERLWHAFLAGQADVSWSRLWVLVALEEWLAANGLDT